MRGYCCRKYWIPVTHLDLLRLEMYGGIRVDESIIDLVDVAFYTSAISFPKILLGEDEYYLALRAGGDGSCIFLSKDGRCRVHDYKPLVCRFYPFVYVTNNGRDIRIEVNENAIGECPGLIVDDDKIPRDIEERLKMYARARIVELELWRDTVHEWNETRGRKCRDLREFIDFVLDRARRDYLYLVERKLWVR